MTNRCSRRQTLQGLALLGGLAVAPRVQGERSPSMAGRALVVRARRDGVIDPLSHTLRPALLEQGLSASVARALGAASAVAAFRRLFRPSDVVGIKVNTLAGRGLSSRPELVLKLAEWLVKAGVSPGNVVIWDRSDRELRSAGFKPSRARDKIRCLGTNQDYDWTPREWGPGGSCFAQVLVSELTALINVGVLKDHDLAGVSAGFKNWYGVIHNPNKYHDSGCNPYLAHLAAHPLIRERLRLTVIDGLIGQCHGGPARSPRWAWPWGGVLVSRDPVAIDTVAWHLIEEQRKKMGLGTLSADGREPRWLSAARALGLGENDPQRIDVVEV